MTIETPLFMRGPENDKFQQTSRLFRRLVEGTLSTGVLLKPNATALQVTERGAGPNMSVDFAPGMAVVAGSSTAFQGYYLIRSTAVENREVAAAPGAGFRTDLAVVRIYDEEVAGAVSGSDFEVITNDTDNAPAPNPPPDSLPLADIRVEAGNVSVINSRITDRRVGSVPPTGVSDHSELTGRGGDGGHPQLLRMYNRGSSLYGGSPPAADSGAWKIIAGTTTGRTSPGGYVRIVLPGGGFPNGLLWAHCGIGNFNQIPWVADTEDTDYNRTYFWVRVRSMVDGSPVTNSGTFRLNYIAIGW